MPVLPEDMEGIFPDNMESACIGRLLFDNRVLVLGAGHLQSWAVPSFRHSIQ